VSRLQIGKMLKERREGLGLTREQLARKAKVTTAYVSMMEAGKRKNPSLAVLQRLAKALGVSLTELLA
jgi:XRE family transcriptional regulator, master regulator for biofilm formation